jgi:hypothetical protein
LDEAITSLWSAVFACLCLVLQSSMIFKKVRKERFVFHFIDQMASRENQSENVTPLNTATGRIVSKALPCRQATIKFYRRQQ